MRDLYYKKLFKKFLFWLKNSYLFFLKNGNKYNNAIHL